MTIGFTYFYDGYIYYKEKTKHFGITGTEDCYLWIIKGYYNWGNIGHPDRVSVNYIKNKIPNSKLVCFKSNFGTATNTYVNNHKGNMSGSFTFEENTLYSILIKVSKTTGGADLSLRIGNNSMLNQKVAASTFPENFFASFEGTLTDINNMTNIIDGAKIELFDINDNLIHNSEKIVNMPLLSDVMEEFELNTSERKTYII